ncbi:MAG: type II toxin-antitoxin system RelE/ParE family toxin [Cyclobacteriaceae bacterium]|nr:type II toxin-antitoxin system RelE/ParE family toxin [Cyclobacteriaceae bacterium]MCK5369829.1 type II toxin-antitoxin system RelE/ParE family toxin [Cyclobacteriaceae bacterium]MCK5468801.1 type II toxin-antitoxin system RelE/ParE family toxin [Cyclobacteriaceae bacterium]MCK5700038.1 type II toxin-antitoxin system RelE/ParE family toxin [Cyclobacteriaceae bacterium]
MEKVIKVEWTDTAKVALKSIFKFHSINSEQSAENIVNDIIDTADSIVFAHQYQLDDVNPNYRRMIARQYKILYKEDQNIVLIMNVVSSKDDPKKIQKL